MSNIIKAIKEIYPNINGGYVYWETQKDGSAWRSPIDGLEWNNTVYAKPTWTQIQSRLSNIRLGEAIEKKKKEINKQRDSLTNQPVSLTISRTRHTFDTGIESRLNIANSYIALGSSDTIEWVTEENRIVDLTPTQVLQICTIIMNNKSREVKLARRRKDAVNALTSVSAIENYDITTTTFE